METKMEAAPLARDANGNPFPLPPEAAFWRVRRHTGGRPSVVLGPGGEPLFISVGADDSALEEASCGPGSYRLEAVDLHRKAVGAPIAVVELAEPVPQSISHDDVFRTAVEALTRTTEAMQRAQVERERAQAARERELMHAQMETQRALIEAQKSQMQMMVQLFDRLTGHGDPVAALQQQLQVQRTLDAETKRRNADAPADEMPKWVRAVEQLGPQVMALLQQLGVGQPPAPVVVVQDEGDDDNEEDEAADEADPDVARLHARMKEIDVALTPKEREELCAVINGMSRKKFVREAARLADLSLAEAVARVRHELLKRKPNGTAHTPTPKGDGEA